MIYMLLVLTGLALGSFTNALVWRVFKQSGIKGAKKKRYSIIRGRSMCPTCNHTLVAKDLVPVLSWLSLRGKCRYCKAAISPQYPIVEVLFALGLVLSYYYWPVSLASVQNGILFAVWSVALVIIFALSIYDTKWQLLPNVLVYSLGLASAAFILALALFTTDVELIAGSVIGALLLGGIFWLIYQVSDGKWLGGGDVRLVTVMGILLGWQKSLLAVVLASYIATFFILLLVLVRKYHKKMRIAFGPFLLGATYVTFLLGDNLIGVYKRLSGL